MIMEKIADKNIETVIAPVKYINDLSIFVRDRQSDNTSQNTKSYRWVDKSGNVVEQSIAKSFLEVRIDTLVALLCGTLEEENKTNSAKS